MKVKHIDHIGIAVKSIETAGKFYTDFLGLKIQDEETVEEQKVNVGFIPITDSEVELLESTEPDGPVAKFIEKKRRGCSAYCIQGGEYRRGPSGVKGKRRSVDRREAQERGRGCHDCICSHQGDQRRPG